MTKEMTVRQESLPDGGKSVKQTSDCYLNSIKNAKEIKHQTHKVSNQ